jgi:AhpD family alkylhydroperoxidase
VLRLTGTERAVAEIVAVAEHVASLTAAAAAFQLTPDVPEIREQNRVPLIAPLDQASAGAAATTLGEIAEWSGSALGVSHVPVIWRVMAHQPRLLETTWRKDRLVRTAGAVDELTKSCVALAVAQFRQSDYCIAYYTHALRTAHKLDDRALVDVAGAVMHYVSFNTIAHGMRLHPPVADIAAADVAPGGPLEHVVPAARRKAMTGDL